MKHLKAIIGAAGALYLSGTASAQNISEQPTITLEAAMKAAAACEALAEARGWKVAIWVADHNAVPVYMKTMDGIPLPEGIYTARRKTYTAKIWSSTTSPNDPNSLIGQTLKTPDGVVMNILLNAYPDEGGEPIFVGGPNAFQGGRLIGTIGVGGAGNADEECARAGVAALRQ